MAAIKPKQSPLQALTTAALLLPGLMAQAPVQAEESDEFSFQYGHYEEGKRNLGNVHSQLKPISVESQHAAGRVKLSDRIKLAFNFTQDTWGGATPFTTAPAVAQGNKVIANGKVVVGASPMALGAKGDNSIYFDKNLQPGIGDEILSTFTKNTQLVHTMTMASPETRKQGDFQLGYEWDEAAVDFGAGISKENDYESRFVSLGGRLDFNQKLTTLSGGLSYTNSTTSAIIDHDANPYINETGYSLSNYHGISNILKGNKVDWAPHLSLTQVLNKDALLEIGASYTNSGGYQANPYKATSAIFVDPNPVFTDANGNDIFSGSMRAFLEQRPRQRDQWSISSRFVQYVQPLDASLHLDYRYAFDNWGINAHTFQADWVQPVGSDWTITPRVRYYSQDAAYFYYPYLVVNAAADSNVVDYNRLPVHTFSSDHRLSAYGALSGGVTINKQFGKAVSLEAGFEYYTHQGSLKIGGGGEGDYANFSSYMVNGVLKVNLSALGHLAAGDHAAHHHQQHQHAAVPAGVMFAHMMEQADSVMVGYRYMYSRQDGDFLSGTQVAGDQSIVNQGCPGYHAPGSGPGCIYKPLNMDMHMHMLDLMYAPTDWLNVMLMPQFVDMNMQMSGKLQPNNDAAINAHQFHTHTTGGIGDTSLYALFKLFRLPGHELHAALGVSAPTGKTNIQLRRMHQQDEGLIHYGMQLGSGTWDFKPSLTYTGNLDDWAWGAQVSGTKRLETQNPSGYALGDNLQSTAWGSYSVTPWLSGSVRGIYTVQNSIFRQFNATHAMTGVMDYPGNYGGHYWDVGFGINATIPDGKFAGHSFGVEWLQPVEDNVYGYQLQRSGTLNATWSYGF